MARITRHGGASDATTYTIGPEIVDVPQVAPVEPAAEPSVAEPVVPVPEPAPEPTPEPAPPVHITPSYDHLLTVELKAEAERRGLSTMGSKADLIARLVASDTP